MEAIRAAIEKAEVFLVLGIWNESWETSEGIRRYASKAPSKSNKPVADSVALKATVLLMSHTVRPT